MVVGSLYEAIVYSLSKEIIDNLVPISDMAGKVVAVGEDAGTAWKVGDRVSAAFSTTFIDGETTRASFAGAQGGDEHGVLTEFKAYRPEALVTIPEHLSYVEASTLPCAAVTAYNGLYGGPKPLKAGDTVLALGTGGVSIFGFQFGVAAGANVIVTSSSDKKLELAKKLGATHTINYNTTPDWENEVLRLTGGEGVDHVLEVAGSTLLQSIAAARSLPIAALSRSVIIRGIWIGSAARFREMNRLITANPEKTRPVVDKVFGFDQAVEAFEYLDAQKHVGKIVISVV
ncbi:NAD(P)-binding protein [Cylindrobasidium torrendii FP15055 ss-10]|uniref:NAD(P)-binding protein n=1 Tax=Cylindrobasidium torrendii FP15055 ss-10 TaxID=1314674 RepID=A0A0D7BEQ7_9AGAR|nr:NAD(P)-binding protein [Cylindrobasidium torrendii FP15055 ss-10]